MDGDDEDEEAIVLEAPELSLAIDGDAPVGLTLDDARALSELKRAASSPMSAEERLAAVDRHAKERLASAATTSVASVVQSASAAAKVKPVASSSSTSAGADAMTPSTASARWRAASSKLVLVDGDVAVGLSEEEARILRELRKAHGARVDADDVTDDESELHI